MVTKTKKAVKVEEKKEERKFLGISSILLPYLSSYKITAEQFIFCELLYYKYYTGLYNYAENIKVFSAKDVDQLIKLNFIKVSDPDEGAYEIENLETTGTFNIILKRITDNVYKREIEEGYKTPKMEPLVSWFDSWYELFPQGVKSGGYLVRSGKNICFKKLQKFIREHAEFSKEQIIEATRRYVADFQKTNYSYMKIAPYFIEKGGVSTLEDYCNNLSTKPDSNKTTTERSI